MEKIYLSQVKTGETVVLSEVQVDNIKKHKRLIELGFVKNTKITMLKNHKPNGILVGIRGYSLALDNKLADSILTERCQECKK